MPLHDLHHVSGRLVVAAFMRFDCFKERRPRSIEKGAMNRVTTNH
jgi:hypothetical protein